MKNILNRISKLEYSVTPTPIHKLHNLSKIFNSNIYCKRDDLTGFAFGGNKTRKLDYLIADAIDKGADTLIAVGANQSNFCRIASAYASVCGLEIHLVLGGKKPDKLTGNLMLDYLFGAKVQHIDSNKWDDWENAAKEKQIRMNAEGKKVYYMPIGGSTEIGALGYIETMYEINDYSEKTGIYFSDIFHPTGTAGTQSGLISGKILTGYEGEIRSIAITESNDYINHQAEILLNKISNFLKIDLNYERIKTDDSYIGEGYGIPTEAGKKAFEFFATKEGILLDNVYSAKAASGMFDYLRKEKIKKNSNVLFIHTGGNIHLFS